MILKEARQFFLKMENCAEGDNINENYFVLRVMEFVYALGDKPLPFSIKPLLSHSRSSKIDDRATLNIFRAILKLIRENHATSTNALAEFSSEHYQTIIRDAFTNDNPLATLKFLAHYSFKCYLEYRHEKILDSPIQFHSSVFDHLKKYGNQKFFDRLNETAAELVIDEPLQTITSFLIEDERGETENKNNETESISEKNKREQAKIESEEFVLKIMKVVYSLEKEVFPECLKEELKNICRTTLPDFDQKYPEALKIASKNLDVCIELEGGMEGVYDFYYTRAIMFFSATNFLLFCVMCTKRAVPEKDVPDFPDKPFPFKAFKLLMRIYEKAKQNGKFIDFKPAVARIIEQGICEAPANEDSSSDPLNDFLVESSPSNSETESSSSSENQNQKFKPISEQVSASSKYVFSFIENGVLKYAMAQSCQNIKPGGEITDESECEEDLCLYCFAL